MTPTLRRPRTNDLRGLAPAVALALATSIAVPARAAAPQQGFEQRIAEADAHVGRGEHAEALRAYADAFEAMPPELQVSGVGEFVALAAGKAALDDFAARGDRASLEQGRTIVQAFMAAVEAADPALAPAPIAGAKERLAELEAAMPEAAQAPDEPASDPAVEPAPEPRTTPTSDPRTDAGPARSRVGLALAVGGGMTVLAGVGVVIAGLRQVPWYEGKLADGGWVPTDVGYDQQIADAERVRNIDLGVGVGVTVVGLGLGIAGAVLMARAKRARSHEVAVVPVLTGDRALLGATMRF